MAFEGGSSGGPDGGGEGVSWGGSVCESVSVGSGAFELSDELEWGSEPDEELHSQPIVD